MKTLSREAGNRMWGGGGTVVGSGSSEGGGESGVSASWVNQNFLTKEFFNQLFSVHAYQTVYTSDDDGETWTQDGDPTEIILLPNDMPSEVIEDGETAGTKVKTVISLKDIQSLKGFWTNFYVSALGLSSGGGGGGATALSDLVDVAISSPTNGQVLMYNETTQKWYNGTVQSGGGSVTSITAGTGLSGGTITSSGTIALSTETQTNIGKGVTAYGWGDHAQVGYATETWVGQQGFLKGITSQLVTNALGYTPLSNAATWWGQSANNNVVSGNMTNVGDITMSGVLKMNNGMSVQFKDSGGNYRNVLTFNASNQLAIGYHVRQQGYVTDIQGGSITFGVGVNRVEAMEINSSGLVYVRQGTQGLRIGNGLLTWDSANNALKVSDYNGNSANLYALGGVSALGFSSSGGSTSIDSLTINSSILVEDYAGTSLKAISVTKATSSTTVNYLNIGETWKSIYHDTRVYGYNVQLVSGDGSYTLSMNSAGKVTCPNYLQASRIYLDSSHYLYISGSSLIFSDGSTSRTVATL